MAKKAEEWYMDLPWGKLALITWGDTSKKPALMVHGYMDSAATFTFLVEKLPDTHCYIAFDMPGHGKSAPIPLGPLINQGHIVEVVKAVVVHMKWKRFVYISHSMGFIIGAMYNRVYPHKISRMINIDPPMPTAQFYFSDYPHIWYRHRYHMYYAEAGQWKQKAPRLYTKEQAVKAVMRNRKVTQEQAEVIISRSLVPVGNGTYRLSWERNAKLITMLPISAKTFYKIVTTYSTPMLSLNASEDGTQEFSKGFAQDLMKKIRRKHPYYLDVTIEGGHDIHITNPEDCAKIIIEFISSNKHNIKSKL